jgi:hypothetical protein
MKNIARLIAAAVVAVSAVAVVPAGAKTTTTTGCGGTTTLRNACAVTKVSAATTSMVRINLTRPATLADDGITVTGTGRVVGAALMEGQSGVGNGIVQAGTSPAYGADNLGGRLGFSADSSGTHLPAGVYRLYVLADGSPVTVTIRFGGLPSGTVTLTPSAISGYRVHDIPMRPSSEVGGNVLAGAVSAPMQRTGIMLRVVHLFPVEPTVGALNTCVWTGIAPPEASTRPGCPGGAMDGVPLPITEAGAVWGNTSHTAMTWPAQPGAYGQGGYVTTNSTGATAKALGVWFPL